MAINQLDNRSHKSLQGLHPARLIDRCIRNWYWFLIFIVLAIGVAWAINRYTTKIYPVRASLIFKVDEENYGANLLYGNTFSKFSRNYYDEFYLMRSFPILQRVVEKLGLDVSFYVRGDIKTIEKYLPHFPVRILPVEGYQLPYGKTFQYHVLNEDEFLFFQGDVDQARRFKYNDTIAISGLKLIFFKSVPLKEKYIGSQFEILFQNPYDLAISSSNQMNLSWSEKGSGAIDVYMSGPVPEKLVDFLNGFISEYQQFDIERKSKIYTKSVQFLDRQIDLISDSLRYYEMRMARQSAQNKKSGLKNVDRMSTMGASLDEKELQMRLQQRYYDYLEHYMNNTSDFSQVLLPSSLGVSDPVLSELVSGLVKLQFELRSLQDQAKNSKNPLVKEMLDKIEYLKRDIEEGVRSAKEIMTINRNFYKERMDEMEQMLVEQPEQVNDLALLQRNYKMNEGLYSFIIQKRAEASLSKASTTSDISVLNNPQIGALISPKPLQNYLYALLIGLILPLAAFVLKEYLNDKLQSKEDIEAITTVPVIGTIGHFAEISELAVATKPRSFLAESFRALRSNLNYFTGAKDKKIILVTSSISGEGKSFTSINIATVLAFSGKRTVLLAGDMRKTSIVKEFDLPNLKGLSSFLSNQAALGEILHHSKVDGLDYIPPGPIPPNPAELYLGERTNQLMKVLLETYDYVIIDSPPVGMVSDAMALLPIADHILFVTRQNYTPLSAISQLQNMVEQGQVQHVSIVLNDIKRVGMGYGYKYGYGFDYGYGYQYGRGGYFGKNKDEGGYYA